MTDTSPLDTPAASGDPAPASAGTLLPRPRIRTGAVIWGLLLTALGGWVLWMSSTPERRTDALEALLGLDPLAWTVIVLVAAGGLITLIALASVIRRLQSRATSRE